MALLKTRACIQAGVLVTAIYSATSLFPPSRACMTSDAQKVANEFLHRTTWLAWSVPQIPTLVTRAASQWSVNGPQFYVHALVQFQQLSLQNIKNAGVCCKQTMAKDC